MIGFTIAPPIGYPTRPRFGVGRVLPSRPDPIPSLLFQNSLSRTRLYGEGQR